ncbi:MAG: helix-turn-helix transcriptional regulator [Candidatus Omnitrophica bacterium]|nr:helix-turn-helix transcriptional regulator [Candidatus Omnitrophota bacterium]
MFPTGRVITLWRLERGMSQKELADKAGIPRPNLSVIERGGRDLNLSTLRRIAAALDIRPGLLADGIAPSAYVRKKPWTRESLDNIALYLCGKTIQLNPNEKKAAELFIPLVSTKEKLSARGKERLRTGARREDQALMRVKQLFTHEEFQNILNRVDKNL